ncbi:MAG: hypothetical protein LH624_18240, partial [Cryobacterium sp.]|nr:hypothetical protein [Cryobacterium sp.]
ESPRRAVGITRRLRDQQRATVPMLDLEGGRHVAAPPRQPSQHDEAPPMQRMALDSRTATSVGQASSASLEGTFL